MNRGQAIRHGGEAFAKVKRARADLEGARTDAQALARSMDGSDEVTRTVDAAIEKVDKALEALGRVAAKLR